MSRMPAIGAPALAAARRARFAIRPHDKCGSRARDLERRPRLRGCVHVVRCRAVGSSMFRTESRRRQCSGLAWTTALGGQRQVESDKMGSTAPDSLRGGGVNDAGPRLRAFTRRHVGHGAAQNVRILTTRQGPSPGAASCGRSAGVVAQEPISWGLRSWEMPFETAGAARPQLR